VVVAGVGGASVGFVLGAIMGAAAVPLETITLVTTLVGMVPGLGVGIWAVRSVLRRSWSDFRIVLVSPR
jgi:hypothetical protein